MKKRVNLVLEFETDDGVFFKDDFIEQEIEQVLECCTNDYRIMDIKTEVVGQFIKTCPFCGGEAELLESEESDGQCHYGAYYVKCSICGIQTSKYINNGYYGVKYSKKDVVDVWNRRVGVCTKENG